MAVRYEDLNSAIALKQQIELCDERIDKLNSILEFYQNSKCTSVCDVTWITSTIHKGELGLISYVAEAMLRFNRETRNASMEELESIL